MPVTLLTDVISYYLFSVGFLYFLLRVYFYYSSLLPL